MVDGVVDGDDEAAVNAAKRARFLSTLRKAHDKTVRDINRSLVTGDDQLQEFRTVLGYLEDLIVRAGGNLDELDKPNEA